MAVGLGDQCGIEGMRPGSHCGSDSDTTHGKCLPFVHCLI
jgi:hypothetical protein